jgi:hypothetical protein
MTASMMCLGANTSGMGHLISLIIKRDSKEEKMHGLLKRIYWL